MNKKIKLKKVSFYDLITSELKLLLRLLEKDISNQNREKYRERIQEILNQYPELFL